MAAFTELSIAVRSQGMLTEASITSNSTNLMSSC